MLRMKNGTMMMKDGDSWNGVMRMSRNEDHLKMKNGKMMMVKMAK
jgi:hypothetical protein